MRRERYEMGLFTGRKFEILRGRYGRRLTLFTRWSSEVERTVKRLGVVELEFNHAKGWRGDDVSFLKRLPQLLVFEIIDFKIRDISEIHSLGNLRALDVNTYCDTEIDFSRFPLLEEASLEWRSGVRSLLERHTLRKLFINHYPGSALADFSSLIQLEFLSLKSPKIERIGDVSQLTRLQTVELGNARVSGYGS